MAFLSSRNQDSKFENTNDLHHFKEQSTETNENDVKKMIYICVDTYIYIERERYQDERSVHK